MEDVRFDDLEFVIGTCGHCARDVLTYPDADEDGAARWRCVHCEELVARVQIARGAELPDHGYGLLESQGCGNPSCGGGQCARRTH